MVHGNPRIGLLRSMYPRYIEEWSRINAVAIDLHHESRIQDLGQRFQRKTKSSKFVAFRAVKKNGDLLTCHVLWPGHTDAAAWNAWFATIGNALKHLWANWMARGGKANEGKTERKIGSFPCLFRLLDKVNTSMWVCSTTFFGLAQREWKCGCSNNTVAASPGPVCHKKKASTKCRMDKYSGESRRKMAPRVNH